MNSCLDEHLDAGSCLAVNGGVHCIPILVIPGVQKAGTGIIRQFLLHHDYLQSSEQGFSRSGKEINFYNSDRSTAKYLDLFPKVERIGRRRPATEFFFDKSPNYMTGNIDATFKRMAGLAPSVRIVILLRNPTDRAFSAFKHDARHGRWFSVPSENSLNAAPECNKLTLRYYNHPEVQGNSRAAVVTANPSPSDFQCALSSMGGKFSGSPAARMLDDGVYVEQLEAIIKHFPREQVCCI